MPKSCRQPPDFDAALGEFLVMYDDICAAASPSEACSASVKAPMRLARELQIGTAKVWNATLQPDCEPDSRLLRSHKVEAIQPHARLLPSRIRILQRDGYRPLLSRHQRDVVVAVKRRHNQIAALTAHRFHAHHQCGNLRCIVQVSGDQPLCTALFDLRLHVDFCAGQFANPLVIAFRLSMQIELDETISRPRASVKRMKCVRAGPAGNSS